MELISIITPAYNAEKYISETIDSVLKQTYVNWELIIVDDCSTDSTSEIVQNYQKKDDRIKYYRLANNSGAASIPRNVGLEKAKGTYVTFLDSDDIWLPEKLEKQMLYLQQTNSDLIYTNTVYFYPDGSEIFLKTYLVPSFFSLLMVDRIALSSVLVKRTDDLYFEPSLKVAQDHLLWLLLYKKGYKFYLVNEFLTKYRYNSDSILHSNPFKSLLDGYKVIQLISKRYNYRKPTIIFFIVSQTIMRVGNVLLGIITRKMIRIFNKNN